MKCAVVRMIPANIRPPSPSDCLQLTHRSNVPSTEFGDSLHDVGTGFLRYRSVSVDSAMRANG